MRQKTKLGSGRKKALVKPPTPPGPAKEKTQITLRLDKQLMNAAFALIKQDNSRITNIVERGLMLALAEAEYLPRLTSRVRFVVNNATREQERKFLGLAIRMVESEVRKDKASEYETKIVELLDWYIEGGNLVQHAQDALDLYARFGRSPEEAATAKLRA
jgi:hypothetical protein